MLRAPRAERERDRDELSKHFSRYYEAAAAAAAARLQHTAGENISRGFCSSPFPFIPRRDSITRPVFTLEYKIESGTRRVDTSASARLFFSSLILYRELSYPPTAYIPLFPLGDSMRASAQSNRNYRDQAGRED